MNVLENAPVKSQLATKFTNLDQNNLGEQNRRFFNGIFSLSAFLHTKPLSISFCTVGIIEKYEFLENR